MHPSPVETFLAGYRAAVYEKDLEAFCALYADDVCIFDAWGGPWSTQGIGPLRASTEDWFTSLGDERVQVTDAAVQSRTGDGLALVHGIWRFSAIAPDGRVLRWLENRFSVGLRAAAGRWQVCHQHTSSPADFTNGKVQLRRPEGTG